MELTWGTAEKKARETFMEKKDLLHYWDARKEEEEEIFLIRSFEDNIMPYRPKYKYFKNKVN